jgi:hypothetical protein
MVDELFYLFFGQVGNEIKQFFFCGHFRFLLSPGQTVVLPAIIGKSTYSGKHY